MAARKKVRGGVAKVLSGRRSRRGPRSAAERVSGLLVMLPWVLERKRVKLADMAKQFKLTEAELMADIMMAAMCGVPPYSPDALIDVFVDEDEVVAEVPSVFSRPLQLNTAEVFALVTMGQAAMKLAGANTSGPLATALAKVRPLLPDDSMVVVDIANVKFLSELRQALDPAEQLTITYFAPATATRTERTITPRSVFEDAGNWYVSADDNLSGERRVFRVDRIEALNPTGVLVPRVGEQDDTPDDGPEWFGDATQHVTLRVAPRARWVVESYPFVSREQEPDGSSTVTMAVSSEHWLGRLLLRAGSDVSVVEPAAFRDLATRTAEQVLRRYGK
jgi:proteasome accessory factor C